MIDTHSHILPSIDDGSRDWNESIEMCSIAHGDGISVLCATPHYNEVYSTADPDTVNRMITLLNRLLESLSLGIRALPGMEIRVCAELPDLVESGMVIGLGSSRTLLMEFHPSIAPAGFENLARIMLDRNYRILIAHPEKNLEIQEHPEYLFHLLNRFEPWKIMTQVTASSLTGENGPRAKRTARVLLKHNLAHVIASDAHDCEFRPPILSKGVAVAMKYVGPDRSRQMVHDIPGALLDESPAFPDWLGPTNPQKWWRIF